jgi:hypothetical protein
VELGRRLPQQPPRQPFERPALFAALARDGA